MRDRPSPSLRLTRRSVALALPMAALAAHWPWTSALRAESAPASEPVNVKSVRDDGSLALQDGRLVRLAGIDFDVDAAVARQARALIDRLSTGKPATLSPTIAGEDRHGRLVGHLLVEGKWLQGQLLDVGLARVRTDPDTRPRAQEMLSLEAGARARAIGLWADRRNAVVAADQAERAIGRFALVEGRVLKAADIRGRIFLNFGEDWRSDFSVLFEAKAARLARAAGRDPRGLEGKRIRVRGLVRSYNGPLIEATHPEQIEILSG